MAEPRVSVAQPSAQRCGDCDTAFSGNYCPNCGQEARIALPRVGQFLSEMLDETVGISGRLPRTLYTLLFKPARLTTDYVAGRRQRYVRPMRLYLSVSVVYFALLQIATSDLGWISLQNVKDVGAQASAASEKEKAKEEVRAEVQKELAAEGLIPAEAAAKAPSTSPAPATATTDADQGLELNGKQVETRRALKSIRTGSTLVDQRISAVADMPDNDKLSALKNAAIANAPYAIFILMPLTALWFKLYYVFQRRRYAEHLLFSVHLHCFAFLAALLLLIPGVPLLGTLVWIGIPVYLVAALRRMYGSGWFSALLNLSIGGLLYFIGLTITGSALGIIGVLM